MLPVHPSANREYAAPEVAAIAACISEIAPSGIIKVWQWKVFRSWRVCPDRNTGMSVKVFAIWEHPIPQVRLEDLGISLRQYRIGMDWLNGGGNAEFAKSFRIIHRGKLQVLNAMSSLRIGSKIDAVNCILDCDITNGMDCDLQTSI